MENEIMYENWTLEAYDSEGARHLQLNMFRNADIEVSDEFNDACEEFAFSYLEEMGVNTEDARIEFVDESYSSTAYGYEYLGDGEFSHTLTSK